MVQIPQNVGGNMPTSGFRKSVNVYSANPRVSDPYGSVFDVASPFLNTLGKSLDAHDKKLQEEKQDLIDIQNEVSLAEAKGQYQRAAATIESDWKQKHQGKFASDSLAQKELQDDLDALMGSFFGKKISDNPRFKNIIDNPVQLNEANRKKFFEYVQTVKTGVHSQAVNYAASELSKANDTAYKANISSFSMNISDSGLNKATMLSGVKNILDANKAYYVGYDEDAIKSITLSQVGDAVSAAYANTLNTNPEKAVYSFYLEEYKDVVSLMPEEKRVEFEKAAKNVIENLYAQRMAQRMASNLPTDDIKDSLLRLPLHKTREEKNKAANAVYEEALKQKNVIAYNNREENRREGNAVFLSVHSKDNSFEAITETQRMYAEAFAINENAIREEAVVENIKSQELERERAELNAIELEESLSPENMERFAKFVEKEELIKKESVEKAGVAEILAYDIWSNNNIDATAVITNKDYQSLPSYQKEAVMNVLRNKILITNFIETFDKQNGEKAFDTLYEKNFNAIILNNKKSAITPSERSEIKAVFYSYLVNEDIKGVSLKGTEDAVQKSLAKAYAYVGSSIENNEDRKILNDITSLALKEKKVPYAKALMEKIYDSVLINEEDKERVYMYLLSKQPLQALRVLSK